MLVLELLCHEYYNAVYILVFDCLECPHFQVPSVRLTATHTFMASSRTNASCCLTPCWKTTHLLTRLESRSPNSQRLTRHPARQKLSPRSQKQLQYYKRQEFPLWHCLNLTVTTLKALHVQTRYLDDWKWFSFTEQETRMQQPRDPCCVRSWAWPLEAWPYCQEHRHQPGDTIFK